MAKKKIENDIIEFDNVTMRFGDLYANKDVSFTVKENEIHALLGENGAGKSTLMSVLFGLYNQTNGDIKLRGEIAKIKTPRDATKHGIAMLPQHFKLVDDMTVWENIVMGNEKTHGGIVISKRNSVTKLKEAMDKYGININLKKKISKLSTSDKQKVELLKMLWIENDILIFDEPTSILTPQQIEEFLKMLQDLKKAGKTILLITHKLEEIRQVADRCTILRKGEYVGTYPGNTSATKLAEYMVGKAVDLNMGSIKKKDFKNNKTIISFNDVDHKGRTEASSLKDVTFEVKTGEIVGIAAIDGNGQSEIFKLIAGIENTKTGDIQLGGTPITQLSINERYFGKKEKSSKDAELRNILGFIPEDRHKHGILLDQTVYMNTVLQDIDRYKKKYLNMIDKKKVIDHFNTLKNDFDIRGAENLRTKARSLSGGNQQKLIVARELSRKPKALLAVHPTRGLDMGAIRNVYSNIISARNKGAAVLLFSGELDEIIQVSDRILVMNNGRIVMEINNKKKFDKKVIGKAMLDGEMGGAINVQK